jgi:hypothetical protein
MTNTTIRLPIEETLSESWKRVKGAKGSFWAAYGIIFLIYLVCNIVNHFIATPEVQVETNHVQVDYSHFSVTLSLIFSIIATLFTFLLRIGVLLIGIERAKDQSISYKLIFQSLHFWTALPLIGYTIIQLLFIIGFLLLGLLSKIPTSLIFGNYPFINELITALIYIAISCFGIYLTIRLSLGYAFILEKKSGLFSALKQSFHATRCNVLRLLFLYFLVGLIMIVSAIPLGIGLIWTIPLYVIVYGMVYKKLTVIDSQATN